MSLTFKSGCPINLTLEMIGDRWSLIVIRDVMFGNKRHFREILSGSLEGIASNVLANRLAKLVTANLLTRANDPSHSQKAIYSLTEQSVRLVPLFAHMGAWGAQYLDADKVLSARARALDEGGPVIWDIFMDELREIHLGQPPRERSVSARQLLQNSYLKAQGNAAGEEQGNTG